jgi:ElaB/YqjD/DUF883 family membrane-anchored ribosome-binding protein
MDAARLLKNSANLLVGASLIKLLAVDLAVRARQDVSNARHTTNAFVEEYPYRAASVAAAVGFLGGWLFLGRRP